MIEPSHRSAARREDMEPLASPLLDESALVAALEAESQYQRVWMPPEPWWTALTLHKAEIASALHRLIARGVRWPRSETVDVRKPGHGIRPVSVIGPEARIVYRAFVSALISEDQRA